MLGTGLSHKYCTPERQWIVTVALAMALGHPRDPIPWIISGTDANPELWEPRKRQVPVPQAELGPSVAAHRCPLSGFSCTQALQGQSCSMDGMAKQKQTLNSLKSPPASPHVPVQGGTQLPLPKAAAVCSSTYCHIALAREPRHGQLGPGHWLSEMPQSQWDPGLCSTTTVQCMP